MKRARKEQRSIRKRAGKNKEKSQKYARKEQNRIRYRTGKNKENSHKCAIKEQRVKRKSAAEMSEKEPGRIWEIARNELEKSRRKEKYSTVHSCVRRRDHVHVMLRMYVPCVCVCVGGGGGGRSKRTPK